MKKRLFTLITLLPLVSLTGCSKETPLQIASPSGAPALTLYDIFQDENVEINSDPKNVLAYLAKDSTKDVVIAPTNALVAKVIKGGAPFKIASVITFGNFYVASTGLDDNDTIDADDYIVLFQKGELPDKLFNYVYGLDNFTNIHYVNAASDANKCLMTAKDEGNNNADVKYVLLAQPALTAGLAKAKQNRPDVADKIKVVKNVQEDYKTKSNDLLITQASIFVNTNSDSKKIDSFLKSVEEKVNNILADQTDLAAKLENVDSTIVTSKFGAPSLDILKKVVKENSIGLGYKNAKENKGSIDKFLMSLGFTNEATSEELYY